MPAPILCFTSQCDRLAKALMTPAWLCPAFDPRIQGLPQNLKQFTALWDTGATHSFITDRVVAECGLQPIGIATTKTASGLYSSSRFLVGIMLPNNVGFPTIPVAQVIVPDADVLIGMDIITRGDFAVTNKGGQTTFTFRFPSTTRLDFVKEFHAAASNNAPPPLPTSQPPRGGN
jgi:hypothetical protein